MRIENLGEFERDLLRFDEETVPRELAEFTAEIAEALRMECARRTPVDSGEARAGWGIAVGRAPRGTVAGRRGTPNPPTQTGRSVPLGGIGIGLRPSPGRVAELVRRIFRRGSSTTQDLVVFNNVAHIRILDEGGFVPPNPGPSRDPRPERRGRILVTGGFSTQARRGIVDLSVAAVANRYPIRG